MRALTVWQPFAQLIVLGVKGYESRGNPTKVRERIAIHAGVKPVEEVYRMMMPESAELARRLLADAGYGDDGKPLPTGAVIGTVEITDCGQVIDNRVDKRALERGAPYRSATVYSPPDRWTIQEMEMLLGDYRVGRYAWKLWDSEMFDEPVPAKGAQRFWNWEGPGV